MRRDEDDAAVLDSMDRASRELLHRREDAAERRGFKIGYAAARWAILGREGRGELTLSPKAANV